jgi:hypothetical protein
VVQKFDPPQSTVSKNEQRFMAALPVQISLAIAELFLIKTFLTVVH